MIALYLLGALLLLLLNAFFVLAEFAAVKVRPTRIEELADQGDRGAKLVRRIQANLDEYLSVCQVGITFASVGLGFVGEPAIASLIEPAFRFWGESSGALAHTVAIAVAYFMVSFLHILLGELVPKSLAIRSSERAALLTARPLTAFRSLFWLPLVVLNASANGILRVLGVPKAQDEVHSEEELRIILARSQSGGLMSFRRLLFLENVFDLGDLKVRDAMRGRASVKTLRANAPWSENLKTIREHRLSRYPVLVEGQDLPLGILHVKQILLDAPNPAEPDVRALTRPFFATTEDTPLESLLADLQRKRLPLALVVDRPKGTWTGLITLEDVIEEIVGTVQDEFEPDSPVTLGDSLTTGRITLDVEAPSVEEAIRVALTRVPSSELPVPLETIMKAMIERERLMNTYLGRGLALPHARIEALSRPVVVFARSPDGVPVRGRTEKAHIFFILLTPAGAPHIHVRLLARIGGIMESEFVEERLHNAPSADEVLEVIRAGEAASLG